jgi:hypothetical protein
MNRFRPGRTNDPKQRRHVQIALECRRATHAMGFVGELDMPSPDIRFGIDSHAAQPETAAGSGDSARYLAAIGDENAREHWTPFH